MPKQTEAVPPSAVVPAVPVGRRFGRRRAPDIRDGSFSPASAAYHLLDYLSGSPEARGKLSGRES